MSKHPLIYFLVGLFDLISTYAHAVPPPSLAELASFKDILTGTVINPSNSASTTVYVFVSARCPCSASHIPELKNLAREYPKVRFIGVHSNVDEPLDESRAHFEKLALPFPVIDDSDGRLVSAFQALKTPHVFVVDASKKIVFQGGVDDSHDLERAQKHYLRDALAAIARGEKPQPESVRTVGCVIQRAH